MKPFVALLVGCWLLSGHQARAERLDFSTVTCKRFLESPKSEMEIIRAWLDGYYREEDDPPIFDTDTFEADGKKLVAYCTAHPGVDLITAADELFGK
jgi:acid stress chaperone HdeB